MKEFNLGSEVVVSDPCYEIPTWCQAIVKNVLPGSYVPNVEHTNNTGGWGVRVASLGAIHSDYNHKRSVIRWETDPNTIGVDSGQAGIFDKTYYRDDKRSDTYDIDKMFGDDWSTKEGDNWYQRMCSLTLSENNCGVSPDGVVSSSGYGDGSYTLEVGKVDDKVVAFRITFISDEDEYEDDDDD